MVVSRGWTFSICLIAILSTSGLVWGQVGDKFHETPEKPFLQGHSPANGYLSVDASDKRINSNTNKDKNVGKTPHKVKVNTTKKSPRSAPGQHKNSEIQRASPKIGAAGSGLGFQEYNESGSAGSGSFFDGYLLRSLNEKRIIRRKAADDNMSNEDLLKKRKKSFIK